MSSLLPDPLTLQPFTVPVSGQLRPPGSKSLTNRLLLLAALSNRRVALNHALESRDTVLMSRGLSALGIAVETTPEAGATTLTVSGQQPFPQTQARLDMGNSGTTARFLTAALALVPGGTFALDGDEAMRARPMAGLLTALQELGAADAQYEEQPDHFPVTLTTHGWPGGEVTVDATASSQLLSGVLLAAGAAAQPTVIRAPGGTVSRPFVAMTTALMAQWGVTVETVGEAAWRVPGGGYTPPAGAVRVEADATAASYFLLLPYVTGGRMRVAGLPAASLQGDLAFADCLPALGMAVIRRDDVLMVAAHRDPGRDLNLDFEDISDTFLTLAAVAPLRPAATRIYGIAHTRKQETDRIAAMANELRRLGVDVTEEPDALTIPPAREVLTARARQGLTTLRTYEDHRVAMSFALLGAADLRGDGRPWLRLQDPGCCGKTYPRFFHDLARLHREAHGPYA